MNRSILVLLALLGLATTATTGCVVEPTGCTSSYANLTIKNYADEKVDVSILQGPSAPIGFEQAADTITSNSLYEGTYRVIARGKATGGVISDTTQWYSCDTSYALTLTPYNDDPVDPVYAELDISNDTGEVVKIYIDNVYQNSLQPGVTGQYLMPDGNHRVEVYQPEGDVVLADDITLYHAGQLYTLHITSTYPEVVLHNNLVGAFAECVNAFADATPIEFDTSLYNVCPAELGYFSLYGGDHQLEVFGEDSAFEYLNVFQYFPENTTTDVYVD